MDMLEHQNGVVTHTHTHNHTNVLVYLACSDCEIEQGGREIAARHFRNRVAGTVTACWMPRDLMDSRRGVNWKPIRVERFSKRTGRITRSEADAVKPPIKRWTC
jgi:hypothetical protein